MQLISFLYTFSSNVLNNMIFVAKSAFLKTRNLTEAVQNDYNQQGCHVHTSGLPYPCIRVVTQAVLCDCNLVLWSNWIWLTFDHDFGIYTHDFHYKEFNWDILKIIRMTGLPDPCPRVTTQAVLCDFKLVLQSNSI